MSINDCSSVRNYLLNFFVVYFLIVFVFRLCCFLGGVLDVCFVFFFLMLVFYWMLWRMVNVKVIYFYVNYYYCEGFGKDFEIDLVF